MFRKLLTEHESAFDGLENPQFDRVVQVNDTGAEALQTESGEEWLQFTYENNGETYTGVVSPEDGHVIATSSEVTHWFN